MAQSNLNPSHLPSSPAGSGAVSMFPRHGTPYGPARHAGARASHAWRGGRAGPHGSGSREHLRARVREHVHAQGCSCPLCNTSTYRIKPRTAAGAAGSPGGSWAAAVLRDPSPLGEGGHFLPFFSSHCNIKAYFFQASFSDLTVSFSKHPAGRWPGRRWGWKAVSFAQVFFPKRGVAAAALLCLPPSSAWTHIGPAAGTERSREGHGAAPPVSTCPGQQKDRQSVLCTDLGAGRE